MSTNSQGGGTTKMEMAVMITLIIVLFIAVITTFKKEVPQQPEQQPAALVPWDKKERVIWEAHGPKNEEQLLAAVIDVDKRLVEKPGDTDLLVERAIVHELLSYPDSERTASYLERAAQGYSDAIESLKKTGEKTSVPEIHDALQNHMAHLQVRQARVLGKLGKKDQAVALCSEAQKNAKVKAEAEDQLATLFRMP